MIGAPCSLRVLSEWRSDRGTSGERTNRHPSRKSVGVPQGTARWSHRMGLPFLKEPKSKNYQDCQGKE
jgi:hypothetical protein